MSNIEYNIWIHVERVIDDDPEDDDVTMGKLHACLDLDETINVVSGLIGEFDYGMLAELEAERNTN